MSISPELADLLCCPECPAGALRPHPAGWHCECCGERYPEVGGVPFLLPRPVAALGEWRLRLQRLLAELRHDAAQGRAVLARVANGAARSRVKLMTAALDEHARRLAALLAPLDVDGPAPALETQRALGTPLPEAQQLASYYVNVHRDWCWGDEENAAALEAVVAALDGATCERVLVLGAGAGRLAYDLHRALSPRRTVALDINPLFALLARRIYAGESVELYEFPVAPRDAASQALLRTLRAEAPAAPGLEVVLGDATRPPFAPGSFDVVVTPWLIDVLDGDFAAFAPVVNRLLHEGGCWINSGSLSFATADAARQYALDEVLALVAAAGFATPTVSERSMRYLCSPASRHGRVESVVTFRAVRERAAPRPVLAAGTGWLERDDRPVPALPELQSAALTMRICGYVASLVDGRRSVADIAQVLVQDRLLGADGAASAVRGFLHRLHADAQRRARF